ncbi:50S ribosomal protein mrp49 [Xylariomycetidae sp. FL2044]|nr:50S ribosomal protein mrp49 [Xylariomycetidae sp. FL2044]
MVNPGKRMHILQALLALRHGPGAAILPPEITRIHMDFALKWNDGHLGPRKFWKTCLPRLKFWNPAIPMIVNRSADQASPARMSIYFRQTSSSSSDDNTTTTNNATAAAAAAAAAPTRAFVPLAQQPASSTAGEHPAPAPDDGERVVTIEMKGVHSELILSEFLAKTGAVPQSPSPDELAELRQIEDREEKAALDRAIMKKFIDDKRREEDMLKVARQEAEAIRMANQ